MLGHELRRPLTVIRGASTLLIDDADALTPTSRKQMLTLIDRSATEMSDLIDNVLVAVHLELGDIQYALEPVALRLLVAEAVEAVSQLEPASSVEVADMDGLEVEVDREHALRAVRALLANARRFTPEGGTVQVVADVQGDVVQLQVLDRGPGVPVGQRERAFEKFARLDPSTGGAGLGLFLARGLARGMGGEVTLADREDGGTAACFTLRRRA